MISVKQAIDLVVANIPPAETVTLPLEETYGYICAEPINADRDIPPYNRATMDGFCLNTDDFNTGMEQGLEIQDEISAGKENIGVLRQRKAIRIMTGGAVPPGANIVVKIENCDIQGNRVFIKDENSKDRSNIANQGEDNLKGNELIQAGTYVTSPVAAVAASVGLDKLKVFRKPTVSIMTTGNEVIAPSSKPSAYQIRDCNTISSTFMCEKYGIKANRLGIIPDDKQRLKESVQEGLKSDILIMSGGISAGEYDFSAEVLKDCGVKEIYHKIKLRPGKPNYFGKAPSKTGVFVLPGNPVSVMIGFRIFVETYIRGFMGYASPQIPPLFFKIDTPVEKHFPLEYYFPVKITDNANMICTPVNIKSSGDFSNFALADGIAQMAQENNQIHRHDTIPVYLN